ncbi:MAG: hypothetical protein V1918_02445 [Planctomycetota bacterium]
MGGWLTSFSVMEKIFFFSALAGGILFLVRLVLMFLGADHGDVDAGAADAGSVGDLDSGGDFDHGGAVDHGADSDLSFKLLSFQGLTAFFMMFGLVGLALTRESGVGQTLAFLGAGAAGLAAMYGVAKFFSALLGLQSSGTIDMKNALGAEGKVYLTIPAGGTGKVELVVQDHLKIFDAVADANEPIKTGERVRVERLVAGETLVVKKI